ncbi:MAG: 3-phosphoshikimate 1-carboxyvinyltransferase [Anaerolineales bacterium]|nr:3-phosphoshikimate 1-carboxyvinyltransferase [Anaerolineales bacterium]
MELKVNGPAEKLEGNIKLPGDKSISHRGMLLAAMGYGPSRLLGVLRSGVTDAMLNCLTALGVESEYLGQDDLLILGKSWSSPSTSLYCGNSGTTMRLLLGALAPSPVRATIDGSPRLRQRPMGRVVTPLELMGARINGMNGQGQPPFIVDGQELHGIQYDLPVSSAQVKSAVLLAALFAQGETEISEPTPSRDHTERMLKNLGISIIRSNGSIRLIPHRGRLPNFTMDVPGDVSSGAFPIVAATLVPDSEVTLSGVGINPTRSGLLEILDAMGADIRRENQRQSCGEPIADLVIRSAALNPVEIEADKVASMVDELPIFAIAATQAHGISKVSGAEELRFKESDRILEITRGLREMGARIEPQADGFIIEGPTRLHGAVLDPNGDHRIAMAFAVAGLIAEGETTLRNADCIAESYPDFASDLIKLGAEIQ